MALALLTVVGNKKMIDQLNINMIFKCYVMEAMGKTA